MLLPDELVKAKIDAYLDLMDFRPDLFPMTNISHDAAEMLKFALDRDREVGLVYESPWHYLLVDVVLGNDGKPAYSYERYVNVAEQTGGVIVPVLPDNRICLLENYRHTIGDTVLELPRGFAENGEEGWQAAVRELAEEMGVEAVSSKILGEVIPDSGVNGAPVTVVRAEIENASANVGHEGIFGMCIVTPDALDKMISEGKIFDGFTLSAVAMLKTSR